MSLARPPIERPRPAIRRDVAIPRWLGPLAALSLAACLEAPPVASAPGTPADADPSTIDAVADAGRTILFAESFDAGLSGLEAGWNVEEPEEATFVDGAFGFSLDAAAEDYSEIQTLELFPVAAARVTASLSPSDVVQIHLRMTIGLLQSELIHRGDEVVCQVEGAAAFATVPTTGPVEVELRFDDGVVACVVAGEVHGGTEPVPAGDEFFVELHARTAQGSGGEVPTWDGLVVSGP